MSSWDEVLLGLEDTALVRIARERRLVLEDDHGPQWVDLYWVDEVALTLIDLAHSKGESITLVYPAPAGQVAVLLAAQVLLRQFVEGNRAFSVGIVTADPTLADQTWNALRITTTGDRLPIAEVFPSFRAGPDGASPTGGRRPQGVVIGQACTSWHVDHLIVDRLAGPVRVETQRPLVEVVSDPIDPTLRRSEAQGRPIWGWSEGSLASGRSLERRLGHTVPFSVASERLETMAGGVSVRLCVAHHSEAEAAIARAREDLRLLRAMSPRSSDRNVERGLSIAWHHLTTLCSLPCRPSRFDRFGGLPPIAARPTRGFAEELASWASTLDDSRSEVATILASDVADLRAALELGNPIEEMLRDLNDDDATVVVTRTRTAAKALLDAVGRPTGGEQAGRYSVVHLGGLHRRGTWPRAVFVGEPSPWDWHRVVSGLSPRVDVFTLGQQSAQGCAQHLEQTRAAQDHWASEEVRGNAWRRVVGGLPPPAAVTDGRARRTVVVVDGAEHLPEPDPFEPLASLLELDPLDIGGEGPARGVARQSVNGEWAARVPAVEVVTDHGRLLLEAGKPVDVRDGNKVAERRPDELTRGSILLVGRREGRVGLLEALEERLGNRHDLVAARYLLDDYHHRVRTRFTKSGLTLVELHRAMTRLGCRRTLAAVRSWVTEGAMAPQHVDDLFFLNRALGLEMSEDHVRELFAGVQRRRGFRRSAGKALAEAARGATAVADRGRIDNETGLTVDDLRDAIVEATVLTVVPCNDPVPITLLGTLENR